MHSAVLKRVSFMYEPRRHLSCNIEALRDKKPAGGERKVKKRATKPAAKPTQNKRPKPCQGGLAAARYMKEEKTSQEAATSCLDRCAEEAQKQRKCPWALYKKEKIKKQRLNGRLVAFGVPGSEAARPCSKSRPVDESALAGLTVLLALHPSSPRDASLRPSIEQDSFAGQWLYVWFHGVHGYVLLAPDDVTLCEQRQMAEDAWLGVAKATGCFFECRFGKHGPRLVFNRVLKQLHSDHVQTTGVAPLWFSCSSGQWYGAWSDWGRLSHALPCLWATCIVPGAQGPPHSRALANVVTSLPVLNAAFEAAEALAATALKLLEQRDDYLVTQHLLQQARVQVPPTSAR
ncbi:hypothetical protein HPB51_022439 [Rhipicephalus microplus]|uniref:Uncharacterized protein n=1 Tax=Rhipicephalus microplus TaxID=6941 RepID=A0A9J6DR65_RHIMP|nr:hypothetical protein HPB51_022439 [Rhipicephalus microplus]